ncbi:MAG: M48 family metallopeptidase [Nevskiales bacterium]
MHSRLAVLLICLFASSSALAFKLALFSDRQMDQMGDEAYTEIKKKTPISKDARGTARVQCVAQALTREVGGKWEVNLFAGKEANAFALPGGKIGVYEGLLQVATTQGQLAAVLGHEIGHVQAEHANQRVSTSVVTDLGLRALEGFTNLGQSRTAMAALGLGAQFGVLLPFSRGQESAADGLGLKFMSRAGFHPSESVALWQNMQRASGKGPPQFLSTHPSSKNRIRDLQKAAPQYVPVYQQAQASGKRPNC